MTIIRHPGERADPSPGGPRSPRCSSAPVLSLPRERAVVWAGVEPPRARGRPSGARESQLYFGYIITKIFSKILLDITTTTTTEKHYIIRIAQIAPLRCALSERAITSSKESPLFNNTEETGIP